jgi:methionine-S-sulfoxide reductase
MTVKPSRRVFLGLLLALGAAVGGAVAAPGKKPTNPSPATPTPSETKTMTTPAATRTTPSTTATATLAGGCFWGVEDLLRKIPGVITTDVGYTGGALDNATYKDVKTGSTGHAEAVQIVYDPAKLRFEDLLLVFFRIHDPTTANRQGNDVGTQYRSAIFYHDDAQRQAAEKVKAQVDRSGKWPRPVVTQIVPFAKFWRAEEYHQDYLAKDPGGYTCHYDRGYSFE